MLSGRLGMMTGVGPKLLDHEVPKSPSTSTQVPNLPNADWSFSGA